MGLNSDNRTTNATKNVTAAFVNKFALLLLTFVSRKFFVQFIGVEYLGIHSLFANILTLLSMADLGLSTAMNVSLYKPIAENDTKKLSALLNYYKKLYNVIAFGIAVVGLTLTPFLQHLVNLNAEIPYLKCYYVLYLANTVISYLFVYKSAIVNADQKNYIISKIAIWVNLGKVFLQIIVIVLFRLYFIYVCVEVLATLINNLIVSMVATKMYPFLKRKEELDSTEKKDIFSNIFSVFLYKVSYGLINGTDNILISIMIGTVTVGLYSNYLSITSNLEMFIALVFSSLTAGVGNLVVTNGTAKRYETFKVMQAVSFWICGIVTTCLLFLTQDFITLWLGKTYVLDNIVLLAIVCNIFFSTCMRPVWTFREGTGMYAQIRYIMLATAIMNLVLSIILGKIMGLSGIIFATSISKICTYFWYEPKILFTKFFEVKVRYYYFEYLKNMILVVSSILCSFVFTRWIQSVTWFLLFIKAVICFILCNFVYYLGYKNTNEFKMLFAKVKSLLFRKF